MSYINISLDTLKAIVKKADEELGGTDGTVWIRHYEGTSEPVWGTKEHYYSQALSRHSLREQSGQFYADQLWKRQLVKPEKANW
jgi:hypothetical protein